MKINTLLLLSLFLMQNAIAEVYYCVDTDAFAFEIIDGRWQQIHFERRKFKIDFDASKKSFLLHIKKELQHPMYLPSRYDCNIPFDFVPEQLSCIPSIHSRVISPSTFSFNTETGHYVKFSGTVSTTYEGDSSTPVQFGQCEKFD